MKKLSTLVGCLLIVRVAVAAPTANEDFVISEDAQTFTNAVNAAKAYTDGTTNAAVVAANAYTDTATNAAVNAANAYTDAATNALDVGVTSVNAKTGTVTLAASDVSAIPSTTGKHQTSPGCTTDYLASGAVGGPRVINSSVNPENDYTSYARMGIAVKRSGGTTKNYLYDDSKDGIARMGDLAASVPGNYATVSNRAMSALQSFDESDPTVPEWAKSSSKPSYTASEVGAYSAANGTTLAAQVATIGAHLNAEDARFVVTNYNSTTHTPEAYVEIKLPDDSWSLIWSEMTRWNWLFDCFMPSNYYGKAAIDTALADKADRAWGFYDSTTGEYAPDGYTWISSEKIAIAANLAYQRTVTTEGAIWVLESNGTVTETGGLTNGFFRISDDEGNALFEIVKGNKRTVGADASSCQIVAGFALTKLQIGYSIVADVHPTIYVCESLKTQNWKAETDSDCIANVSWSGTSGAYVAQVQGKSAYPSLFVKATYEVGGETYINNSAPVSMQYIMLNGVKYAVGTATISGNTVLTLTVAP